MTGDGSTARKGVLLALAAALAAALLLRDGGSGPVSGPREVPGFVWGSPVTVDTGPAVVGPWRMNASDWRYVDDPTAAFDGAGGIGVAWVDQARRTVLYRRFEAGEAGTRPPAPHDGAPTVASRSPDVFSWLPRLAFAPDDPDRVHLLWQEIVFSGGTHGGEAYFARSTDGGRTFGEPLNLSRSPAGDGKGRLTEELWQNGSLALAVGADGTVHAAWTEYEGRLWHRRSTDGGASFEPAVLVAGSGGSSPARGPALAAGKGDTVYLAWVAGGDAGGELRLATSADGGASFGEVRAVGPDGEPAHAPSLAVAADGTLHLAWSPMPVDPGARPAVHYARSSDGGRSFSGPRTLGTALAAEGSAGGFPTLAVGEGGTVYVVWELFPDGAGGPRGLGFAASRDGGETFTAPAVVPGTAEPGRGANGSLQGYLTRKLDADVSGRVAVVNSRIERGASSRVRLVRGRDTLR